MSSTPSQVSSMKPVRGIVQESGEGEVVVLLKSGTKLRHKMDNNLKFGEAVLVLYDYEERKITDIVRVRDFDVSKGSAPLCPDNSCGAEQFPIDEDEEAPSRSLTVALEEFFLEGEI